MAKRYKLQISARILSWPRQCACCSGEADTKLKASATRSTGKRVVRTTKSWWEIPHCSPCVRHISNYNSAMFCLAAGVVIGPIAGWVIGQTADSRNIGWAVLVFLLGLGITLCMTLLSKAKKQMTTDCAAVESAVLYHRWYGTSHEFSFTSNRYVTKFAEANHRKTMSDIVVMTSG